MALLVVRSFTDLLTTRKWNKTLSRIIQSAYQGAPESPPSLFVLTKSAKLDTAEPSHPPVPDISSYPFLSHSIDDLATFLDSHNSEKAISSHQFLIADQQTIEDSSLLFVDRGYDPGTAPETVRLDATQVNAIPVAVQIGTTEVNEVRASLDGDGIYRGGSGQPRKGEPAPRKRLGEEVESASWKLCLVIKTTRWFWTAGRKFVLFENMMRCITGRC